jgi:hypothetical protein
MLQKILKDSAVVTRVRRLAVVSFCLFWMLATFSHAFPTFYGLEQVRDTSSTTMEALGINQQWRMFTGKITSYTTIKLAVVYQDGSQEVVPVRKEQVSFSRSAENRFSESVLLFPQTFAAKTYLAAHCQRLASTKLKPREITMLNAQVGLPASPLEAEKVFPVEYKPVGSVTCK